jgi:hypothetical protein
MLLYFNQAKLLAREYQTSAAGFLTVTQPFTVFTTLLDLVQAKRRNGQRTRLAPGRLALDCRRRNSDFLQ